MYVTPFKARTWNIYRILYVCASVQRIVSISECQQSREEATCRQLLQMVGVYMTKHP
jgi:hypothetical protein